MTGQREKMNQLLSERLARRNRFRRAASVAASVAGHGLITALVALAPALAARQRQLPEFVQVQIVPLQALGVPEPVRPAEQPVRQDDKPRQRVPAEPEKQTRPAPATAPAPSAPPTADTSREVTQATASQPAQRLGSPTGSPLATSPFGTAVAGFDNPDFVYGYYVEQMLAMIGRNWVRPSVERDAEMTIHFRISRDGGVTDIEIVESSGQPSFDLAGLRAVRLASPLPPLPASFPHHSLGVNLIIR